VIVGNDSQPLPMQWDQIAETGNPFVLQVPSDPEAFNNPTNLPAIYTGLVRFPESRPDTLIRLDLGVFIDNLYYPLDNSHQDGFTSLFILALDATLECHGVDEGGRDIFYSSYKNTPISYTLPLDPEEPHSTLRTQESPQFNYLVGDPPVDPGEGWAGVYNYLDLSRLLSPGGASVGKSFDPFQVTDAHKNLPASPGLIITSQVQNQGELITLASISNLLDAYTQHLYHQREIQALRFSTRVLMLARGKLQNLILRETQPGFDDTVIPQFGGLTIGAANLRPAVLNEPYVGTNSVTVENTIVLFPFGVSLPGFATSAPGEVGHKFIVSGGTSPYSWCLRRTRSSQGDPARVPVIPGPTPPPYPFDDFGDMITPEPEYPQATRGGGLPPGMLLNQDGLLYGTPTVPGVYLFRLHVKDNTGLRGEATVRFIVLSQEGQPVPCSQTRGTPIQYKTTITRSILPYVPNASVSSTWRGKIEAVGGQTGKYMFFFSNPLDAPRQSVPVSGSNHILRMNIGSGILSLDGLTSVNFAQYRGLWLFDIQATEVISGEKTCDIRAVALPIGTTTIAGIPENTSSPDSFSKIPDGDYKPEAPVRTYLVLEPPVPVSSFTQGKNVYLRGNAGLPLRPDLGGINLRTSIVTSVNPGTVNPVRVIGLGVETGTPSHYYLDYLHSNPCTYFREIVDRFDPVPISPPPPPRPPLPPGSPPPPIIEGSEIDDMIVVGKRIRPLWPV
jgi:hypothetical protein